MTASTSPVLRWAYFPVEEDVADAAWLLRPHLGAIYFSQTAQLSLLPPSVSLSAAPFVHVPLAPLDATGQPLPLCETWFTNSEVQHGQERDLCYSHDGQLLFGCIQLAEAQVDAVENDTKTALQAATEQAYRAVFALIERLHFPHLLRFWNYIADINGSDEGLERYRQFNIGRQDAFLRSGRSPTGSAPAASALGFFRGPLTVYFLAARDAAPVPIENPRQTSAYHYPSQYGPRSPTFSRASVLQLGDEHMLFISGTASIVGHASFHIGDVSAQVRETVANIEALLPGANRAVGYDGFSLPTLSYKVYIRHEEDVPGVHQELRRLLGATTSIIFLRADVCREELLVEIEAVGLAARPPC